MLKRIFSIIFFPVTWFFTWLSDAIYSVRVKIHAKRKKKGITGNKTVNKIKDLCFYWGFLIIPLIFFVITHVVINGNSILLSFRKMDVGGKISFAGIENFAKIFENFKGPLYPILFKNSLIAYVLGLAMTPITITFSYYVYKKYLGSNVFKIMLFLPTIMSSIVSIYIYKVIANRIVPALMLELFDKEVNPLISTSSTMFPSVIFYTLWMGMGNSLLTNLAAMNTVDPSVSEAAMLDGVGFFGELWHIVLPASYGVITLGLITGVTNVFGNTLNLFAFNGLDVNANQATIGYWIQTMTVRASEKSGAPQFTDYAYLSAWGLFVTAIAVPTTLLLKKFIYKIGPSEV